MKKFDFCALLQILDEIEHEELRPIFCKKREHCESKKTKEDCNPPKHC